MLIGSVETFLEKDEIGVYVRIGRNTNGPKLRNRDDVEFLVNGGTSSHVPSGWHRNTNGFVTKTSN